MNVITKYYQPKQCLPLREHPEVPLDALPAATQPCR